jgi:hypothetical protein
MSESASLLGWSNFYVMTGSSAAALTGLMFVVITLVTARSQPSPTNRDGISTFSTPTVMDFAAVLIVSAILVAPWHSLVFPGVCVALIGLWGLGYIFGVMLRTKRFTQYRADLEDWIWYTVLPLVAFAVILGGAIALELAAVKGLFAIGGGLVLLILIGIRNAWDVVTFLAIAGPPSPP